MKSCQNPAASPSLVRAAGRFFNQIRPVKIQYDVFGYAAGSVLLEIGNTKVLCAVTMQAGVPPFLRNSKTGWLTAEYALLPTATVERTQRESTTQKRNGRSIEISRLIGRSLRAVSQLDHFGERTITIDCDVLQADGGTRSACITGAYCALHQAQEWWLKQSIIEKPIILEPIAAISVGVMQNQLLLDLDCQEDNMIDADFNFVLTESGKIIEMQGSVEKGEALSWNQIEHMKTMASDGIKQLLQNLSPSNDSKQQTAKKTPFFSLESRLKEIAQK